MTQYDFAWKFIERPKRIVEDWINKLFGWGNDILIGRDVRKHRGELVLNNSWEVVELLGWASIEDKFTDAFGKEHTWGDYYFVYYGSRVSRGENDREISYDSCCGGFVVLKGKLSMFEYGRLKSQWDMNSPTLEVKLDSVKKDKVTLW